MGVESIFKKIGPGSAIVLVTIFFLVWYLSDFFFIVFGSFLFSIVMTILISFLSKRLKISRNKSFVIAVIILLVIIIFGAYSLFNLITDDASKFFYQIPLTSADLQSFIQESFGIRVPEFLLNGEDGNNIIMSIFSFRNISGAVSAISGILFIIAAGIYFSFSPEIYRKSFTRMFDDQKKAEKASKSVAKDLKLWLTGTFYSMLIVGTLTTISLFLIGVNFSLMLGISAGLLEFIPYFGPIISFIPAFIISFSQSPQIALYVVILYIGIQLIESHLIVPLIFKRVVDLQPAYYLLIQALFGILFGILGFIFAVPMLITLRAFFRSYVNSY